MENILDEKSTLLEHTCKLNFLEPATHYRLTGIIATISKSSRSKDTLKKMIESGITMIRLNFAHESHEDHADTLKSLRDAEDECSKEMGYFVHIAVALDTMGPVITTGYLEAGANAQVELRVNDNIRLSINRDVMNKGNRECIYVDYENIINVLKIGSFVYINDGSIKLIVKEVGVDSVTCQVERGGMLCSRKKVNIPDIPVDLPAVSNKDINDISFALENKIDIIFCSARTASAVKDVRSKFGNQQKNIKLIAKIECQQSLQNVDEIISAADGILFASADIAIEMPYAKVFLAQKAVLARCSRAGKPVILATKLLESMRFSKFPTKAEVAELGNAILDGADCVMLSSETAIGKFPIESVACMASICREFEVALWYRRLFEDLLIRNPSCLNAAYSVAIAAVDAARKTSASAIIALTNSGKCSTLLTKYRPRCPILAITRCERTFRQSYLYRGIIPLLYTESPKQNWLEEVDARVQFSMKFAKGVKIIKNGDTVVVVTSWSKSGGFSNTIRLVYAYFEQAELKCEIEANKKIN